MIGPALLHTTILFGNELWRLALFAGALLVGLLAGYTARFVLTTYAARLERRDRPVLSLLLAAAARTMPLLGFLVGLEAGLEGLRLNERVRHGADTMTGILLVVALTWLAYGLVDALSAWLERAAARTQSRIDDMLVPVVRKSLRIAVVLLGALQVATQVSDKPLTSLLAGIGLGGLALAMASQDTIRNFFGSLMIFADKPFELGDRIVVDGFDGPVEDVGLRSTRIRTLDGHLVTIPNSELANKAILNIGRRPSIRRVMNLALPYDTPPDRVRRAVEILKDVLRDHEGLDPAWPPRVFFSELGKDALSLLAIYWYHPPDYWAFMAFGERVNLEIHRRFREAGIEFALPAQTLHLAGALRRPPGGPRPAP